MTLIDFTVFFIFLSILFVIGMISSKKTNTQTQYLVAGRSTKTFPLMATLVMTEFNASTFVSHAAAGYSAGFRALALPGILFICLLFYAATVAKKWKAFNGESIANYFSIRYSTLLGRFTAGCFIFVMLGLTATYIKSFCILMSGVFSQYSAWQISAFLMFIVSLVSIKGGLKSIISIDTFTFVSLVIFMPIMAYFCIHYKNSNIHLIHKTWIMPYQALPTKFIISILPFACLCYLASPWQGLYFIT